MTVKLLLPAYGKHGSAIIATNGELRVIQRPRAICHGFANGCGCGKCSPRAKRLAEQEAKLAIAPKRCVCDRPIGVVGEDCAKCGKPLRLKSAA